MVETQKKPEKATQTITSIAKDIESIFDDLSMRLKYTLADNIIPYIFDFAEKEFGVDVTSVDRKHVFYPDGRHDEINIYAEGLKDGRPSFIFGECKAQPGKNDVLKFAKVAERLADIFPGDHYLFMVGYQFHPEVETYIDAMFPRIRIFKSFEFELKYQKRKIH